METISYLVLASLTIVNAALAYVLHTKIAAFDEIFSSIYMNREQIDAIDERLSSVEEEMEDFSDWDTTLNDGPADGEDEDLEDEDFEDEDFEDEDLTEYIDSIADNMEEVVNGFEERLTDMEHSLDNHIKVTNELMTFLDRMVGRLDQIEQHLRDNRTDL